MVGIPGAALVKRGAAIGLLVMMAGCLLFVPASANASYPLFLGALFVLASGVVVVQVVTNPLMFPTIFGLACEGFGPRAADGSGIINIPIFGGAVLSVLSGTIADASGSLAMALALPAACYPVIAIFGSIQSDGRACQRPCQPELEAFNKEHEDKARHLTKDVAIRVDRAG